ncbi:unnamed protein product [Caenorhabditis nigoni]
MASYVHPDNIEYNIAYADHTLAIPHVPLEETPNENIYEDEKGGRQTMGDTEEEEESQLIFGENPDNFRWIFGKKIRSKNKHPAKPKAKKSRKARRAGILDEVKLTDGLGKILVDDYKLVRSEKKVPRIPTEWTVVKILEERGNSCFTNRNGDIRDTARKVQQSHGLRLKENVSGFHLSEYFVDRQSVQAKIRKEMEDVNMDQETEEFAYEQDAHEKDQNEAEFDYHMNEPVERNNKSFIL